MNKRVTYQLFDSQQVESGLRRARPGFEPEICRT